LALIQFWYPSLVISPPLVVQKIISSGVATLDFDLA